MTTDGEKPAEKKPGEMNKAELTAHIDAVEEAHRKKMRNLRALLRTLD